MLSRINSIKNTVYELEGLLELSSLRNDKMADFLPLIQLKVDSVSRMLKDFTDYYNTRLQSLEPEDPDDYDDDPQNILDDCVDDDEDCYESDDDNVHDDDDNVDDDNVDVDEVNVGDENIDTADDCIQADTLGNTDAATCDYVYETVDEVIEDYVDEAALMEAAAPRNDRRPVFCINDRFRFRRELFHNSDAEFNAAMNMLATMDSYDEAEAYFIDDLGWNPESQEVMDFMAIMARYFQ